MNRSSLHNILLIGYFVLFFTPTSPLTAQTPARWTPGVMITIKRVGGTALSPDGNLVAYTVSTPLVEGEQSGYITHIWIASADGRMNRQFTYGDRSCSNPSFSPDGRFLAFTTSRGTGGGNQIWILPMSGGEAEQITEGRSSVRSYDWSPDGSRIAYTMNDPDTNEEAKNRREKRDMRVQDTNYKYSHLYTVRVDKDVHGDRKVQRLTSGNFHINNFDWSPDGKTIVFDHQISPEFDLWSTYDISSVPSDSGKVTPLVSRKGADRMPYYSPDGKWLAFVSDGGDSRWGNCADIYIMPANGGEPKQLSPTPDRSFVYYGRFIGWSSDSREVYVREASRTSYRIIAVPTDGGKPRVVTTGAGTYTGESFSNNGKVMAFIYQTCELAPDVYITDTGTFKPVKLTEVNADFPRLPMGKTEIISWKSSDGLEIEGLLTYPVHYEKGKRYPLILTIHGGPANLHLQTFTAAGNQYPIQAFAQEGYAILRPNPRGSSGYGKDFRFANYNDWGFGDYEDLMTGVDRVIELGVAHPDSLCVMGWSYGGYMTSFIITKTKRFKAASVGAGITNLVSFTGTADIPSFIPDYMGGEPWDNTEAYIKHSAMFHIKGVTIPTQILHGEQDRRVPLSQGQELYNALKRQGCQTEMIVYPRSSHSPGEPKFIEDIGNRILVWFNRHLGR